MHSAQLAIEQNDLTLAHLQQDISRVESVQMVDTLARSGKLPTSTIDLPSLINDLRGTADADFAAVATIIESSFAGQSVVTNADLVGLFTKMDAARERAQYGILVDDELLAAIDKEFDLHARAYESLGILTVHPERELTPNEDRSLARELVTFTRFTCDKVGFSSDKNAYLLAMVWTEKDEVAKLESILARTLAHALPEVPLSVNGQTFSPAENTRVADVDLFAKKPAASTPAIAPTVARGGRR